ncbi:MAG: hypothetical protein AUH43_01710 [Acidobacteria bacterium 13_1_40CM_65_14]|nr:MAG: hypothetical protein AUH43_01710 [Acidobacteria bacterium 13_1_40CM_65_14]
MIEASCAIQLRHDRRKLRSKPPLVSPSTGRHERLSPSVPPRRHEAGQRLDDQHAIALRRAIEQPLPHHLARRVRQLVDGECRKNRRRTFRQLHGRHVVLPRATVDREVAIGSRGLADGPRMAIDPDDARRSRACARPCGARCAGAAAEIDQRLG